MKLPNSVGWEPASRPVPAATTGVSHRAHATSTTREKGSPSSGNSRTGAVADFVFTAVLTLDFFRTKLSKLPRLPPLRVRQESVSGRLTAKNDAQRRQLMRSVCPGQLTL